MATLRVIESFVDFKHDPNGTLYTAGALIDGSNDVTKRHPGRFEDVAVAAARNTETAVSAPGLRRSITRPERKTPRRAAKKAAAKKAPAKPAKPAKAAEPKGDDTPSSEVL